MLDYIESIVTKKKIKIRNDYNQYGLNVYFSKFKNCIFIINDLLDKNLTNQMHYDYLYNNIPFGWQKTIKTVKKDNFKAEIIENIMKFYNIKESEAENYIKFMSSDEIDYVKNYFKN